MLLVLFLRRRISYMYLQLMFDDVAKGDIA